MNVETGEIPHPKRGCARYSQIETRRQTSTVKIRSGQKTIPNRYENRDLGEKESN